MAAEGVPIAYTALEKGVPVVSRTDREFGTVEHVLQIPEEDLFDGIVVRTKEGLRFVDRDCVGQITTARVTCSLDDAEVQNLPQPSAPSSYSADATADSGASLHDLFGRLFGRAHWTQDRD